MADVKIVEYSTEDLEKKPDLQRAYLFSIKNLKVNGKAPADNLFEMGVKSVSETLDPVSGITMVFEVVETVKASVSKFINSLNAESRISFDIVWYDSNNKETNRDEYDGLKFVLSSRKYGHPTADMLVYTITFELKP